MIKQKAVFWRLFIICADQNQHVPTLYCSASTLGSLICESVPLLHDTAHGVYGTVTQVSPQHFTHQLETQ